MLTSMIVRKKEELWNRNFNDRKKKRGVMEQKLQWS